MMLSIEEQIHEELSTLKVKIKNSIQNNWDYLVEEVFGDTSNFIGECITDEVLQDELNDECDTIVQGELDRFFKKIYRNSSKGRRTLLN